MYAPKSYRIRHEILSFLTKKRTEQSMNEQPLEESQFTITEITNCIKFSESDVDMQLNMLWHEKLVADNKSTKPKKYMVLAEGMSVASSMKYLNEGKVLNSQLFYNYATGAFQILIGLAAIITLSLNIISVDKLETQVTTLQLKLERIEELLKQLKVGAQIENNSSDTTVNHQTNLQNVDTLLDSLK